jgi:hypothetical protein
LPHHETEAFSWDPVVIDVAIVRDLDDDPDGNVQHIAEHGITVEEVEEGLQDPRTRTSVSRRTGRPQAFGSTSTGKCITVIWDEVADDPRTVSRTYKPLIRSQM